MIHRALFLGLAITGSACSAEHVIGSQDLGQDLGPDGMLLHGREFAAGSYPGPLVAADLDGDGAPDLVVGNVYVGRVRVLLGQGDGSFVLKGTYGDGSSYLPSVATADVNGDGKLDLIFANSSGSILLHQPDGKGGWEYAAGRGYPSENPVTVLARDLDGDGVPDLVVVSRVTNTIQVLLGPDFARVTDYKGGARPLALAAAAVTSGLGPDLLFTDVAQGNLWVLPAAGKGTFSSGMSDPVGSQPVAVVAADLDGDGRLDVIVVNQNDDSVSVLRNLGQGALAPARMFAVGHSPSAVAVADFDGDGRPDLAVTNQGGNSLSILPGKGDGTFVSPVSYATGLYPTSMAAADVNCDGLPDLVVTNSNSDTVSVFLNRGSPVRASGCKP